MDKRIILPLLYLIIFVTAGCTSESPNVPPSSISSPLPPATYYPTETASSLILDQFNLAQRISNGCTAISPRPTPGPTEQSLFPQPSSSDWQRGSESAPVTIIEYCDFQAQPCAQLAIVMNQLSTDYPDQLRWIYRHYPLTNINDKAQLAVQAAEAAGKQGSFWKIYDLLYANQSEWEKLSPSAFQSWLSEQVIKLGINGTQFEQDLKSPAIIQTAENAWQHNSSIGMPGVPFILLDGKIWSADLPLTYYTLKDYINLDLLENRQFESCPPAIIDLSKSYQATINTAKGEVLIQLFAQDSPLTVNNFVYLAKQSWYDGVTFHRVLQNYIVQSGDPSGTGYGGPGYTFINEYSSTLNFDHAGMIAMANAGKDTNGSQFFITLAPAPQLYGNYTIFGQVIQGMETLQKITLRNPAEYPPPPPGDLIQSITITDQ